MRSTSHRLTTIGGIIALSLAAAACGSPDSTTPVSATGGASKQLKMGIAVASTSANFAKEMAEGATSAATRAGNVDFQVVGPPTTDAPAEVQQFQSLVTTATDGVILENLNPPLFARPASEAVAKGIPVVALDTSMTPASNVTFYVGNDNYDLGAQMALELLKRLGPNPTGDVVIGSPIPAVPVLANRAKGIMETLKKQAPRIRTFGPYETYGAPTGNYDAWSAQVHARPNALAFLGVGDADSYNLAKLKKELGGKWLSAGFDVDGKTLQAVKGGQNFMTMDPEHFLKGYLASSILVDSVRKGTKLPKGWFVSPGLVITSDNVDAVISREASSEAAYAGYKPQIDKLLGDIQASIKPMEQAR